MKQCAMRQLVPLLLIFELITGWEVKPNSKINTIGDYIKLNKNKKSASQFETTPNFSGSSQNAYKKNTMVTDKISEVEFRNLFDKFKKEYNMHFESNENEFRYKMFKTNYMKIQKHNQKTSGFKMSMNEFMVKLPEEFENEYMEKPKLLKYTHSNEYSGRLLEDSELVSNRLANLPSILDWEAKGKVTPIKSQEKCSGCYVFSAVAALESAIMLKFNRTLILSEQEIIDCTKGFRNNGCIGGQPAFVYDYIKVNGINLAKNYFYTATEDLCKAPTKTGVFKRLMTYIKPELNVISLLEFLQYGPVVVNHYIPDDFKYYAAGIFYTSDCYHQTTINHSSLLVGYDFTTDPPFFRLKNSWGARWGEKGYYKVPIGELNLQNPGFCYLANNGYNVFPIVQ